MSFTISNNSAAASSQYHLGKNQSALQLSIKRLASGKRLIAPNDDPGSLSVAMKLNAAVTRLSGARNNVQNATSFLEVQDGVLEGVGRIVTRMAELKGLGSQDPMKSSQDIASYDLEFHDLQRQLYDMSQMTFNGASLFAMTSNNGDESVFRDTTTNLTISIHTSTQGSEGSKISIHQAGLLAALTLETGDLDRSANSTDALYSSKATITAANSGIKIFQPITGVIIACCILISIPEVAAKIPPINQIYRIILSVFIPVTLARSGLSDVALIAFPNFVLNNTK